MRLDTHQHFWSLANSFTQWPTAADGVIYRDFGPEEFKRILAANRIEQTILVQAAPDIEETKWCLSLADENDYIAGVVGWIDFEAADALEQLDTIACNHKLVGLRPMVQSIAQPGWLLQDAFAPIFELMIKYRLCFDSLVLSHQIRDVTDLASRYPGLSIVLDHAGKPPIISGDFERWSGEISQLAAHQNAFCKVSGLWTEAGTDHDQATIEPWFNYTLSKFGPDRLMWGSDWPVLNLAGSYADWLTQSLSMLDHLNDHEIAGIMGENGKRFYGI